jgi:hypothetical protein
MGSSKMQLTDGKSHVSAARDTYGKFSNRLAANPCLLAHVKLENLRNFSVKGEVSG